MRRLAWVIVMALVALCPAVARADWNGDGHADVLGENSAGHLFDYTPNGAGWWINGNGQQIGGNGDGWWLDTNAQQIGGGWAGFTAVFPAGDFNGDGHADVFARTSDGHLLLYRGNGSGGWIDGSGGPVVGSGWGGFTVLLGGGDFDGDGLPDVLAQTSDGHLFMYRGNGAGGWITGRGDPLGEGFSSLSALTFVPGVKTPTPPPPPPPAPPVVPVPGGNVQVKAGKHCTVPGGRMKVTLKVHHVPGRAAAHVRRVVFFVPHGSRLVDHHRPYLVHLRMNQPAGTTGRVYARIYFRRAGERKLRHRTVSRRFRMCG